MSHVIGAAVSLWTSYVWSVDVPRWVVLSVFAGALLLSALVIGFVCWRFAGK